MHRINVARFWAVRAALFLISGLMLAQNPQPYLVIIPSGGVGPDAVGIGGQAGLYGRGFCPPPCSPATITMGNDIVAPFTITTAIVNNDGTFTVTLTMNVPFAWRYILTATQTTAANAVLSASVPIIVGINDTEESPIIMSPRPNQPVANSRALVRAGIGMGVTEFPPNIAFDGRSVAIDVSTANNAVAIAASESGGLWKTTDTGATWSPLSGLLPFRMSDVKMAPSNDQIVIATAWGDSHTVNGGGIWRSTDGGATWQKPPTADPPPASRCPPGPDPVSAWGISFAPGTNDVFVGTDCGVASSHDLGATWTHTVPDATSSNYQVYGIVAQHVGSRTVVDACGADGHHRSNNGGSTWTPTSTALPGCPFIGVHTIAASPLESNVLFAATDASHLYESDDGGVTWENLHPPSLGQSRTPWVATHLSSDGNGSHFDIYFGSGNGTARQTCFNIGGPGLRCSTLWNGVNVDHGDQNGIAFSTSSNCAQYIVSDGGVHKTTDCGANWHITGNGTGGYHALQVYEVNGEVHPTGTDLYFGTQDNNLWASPDNGLTWPNSICCEGFFIQMLHDSLSNAGQTITFMSCGACKNNKSAADFVSAMDWNNPPRCAMCGDLNPFIVDQGVYLQWGFPNPPASQLYITIDTGTTWTPVAGASTALQLIDHLFVSGPPANPVVYQMVQRPNGKVGLIKITGVRSGLAAITDADTGLDNIGFWPMGVGTFLWQRVFGVDRNNPNHLIAGDFGLNKMMISTDGGASWHADNHLTDLVTGFGQFQFSRPNASYPGITTQAHAIAFDPSNGNRILIGTEQAGIIVSTDGGTTWGVIAGSNAIPAVSSFFFDEVQKDVIASSYGRGLWKLDLSQLTVFAPSITKSFAASSVPLNGSVQLTFTISNSNATASLTGVGFMDTLPGGLVVSSPAVISGSCGGGTITANALSSSVMLSGATLSSLGSCTFSVNVTGAIGGLQSNSVTVTSSNGGTGNTSMASITVVLPPTIMKTFEAAIIQVSGSTVLTFTITNPNGSTTLTGIGFTDVLPSGLNVATSSGSCDTGTITAVSGSSSIKLSNATLASGANCTFSVTVVGNSPGVENNSTGLVTSNEGGNGKPGTATLTVLLPPTITKTFGSAALQVIGPNSTSLSFTITNPATNPISLTGIGFSDLLPSFLVMSTPSNGLMGGCPSGTFSAAPGSNSIGLSGAALAPGASCTFSVQVTAVDAGSAINTTTPVVALGGILVGLPAQATISADYDFFLWFFLESGGGASS